MTDRDARPWVGGFRVQGGGDPADRERAFRRLLDVLFQNPEKRNRLLQAMSILGVTPRDPAWVVVLVAFDLLEAQRSFLREGAGEAREQIAKALSAVPDLALRIDDAADKFEILVNRAALESASLKKQVESIGSIVSDSISRAATGIGQRIVEDHCSALEGVVAQRDVARGDLRRARNWRSVAVVVAVFLVGLAAGEAIGARHDAFMHTTPPSARHK